MKICIATDAWSPQINGVVTTLTRTAETLRNWGHHVLILAPDRFCSVACPTYPEIRLSLTSPAAIRRLLGQWQPDAVHIATEGPLGWATRAACRRLGLAFTTSYHTRFPEYVRLRFPVPLSLSYALLRRFHGAARRTMAAPTIIDELAARGLRIWFPGRAVSIPPCSGHGPASPTMTDGLFLSLSAGWRRKRICPPFLILICRGKNG